MKDPTFEACLAATQKLNAGIPQTEETLLHKARWLYIISHFTTAEDMPVLMDFIQYEKQVTKQTCEKTA